MIGGILGALLIGLSLGLLGSGGSILTVPILAYIIGRPEKLAIIESLAIVGGIAAVGAVQYAIAKTVAWRVFALFAPTSILGTIAGAWLASFVTGPVQLLVFGCVMMGAAIAMWKRAKSSAPANPEVPPAAPPKVLPIALQGFVVGVMTGFVGVGGGFLIVPALVLLAKLDMRRAVGTSLALITINSVSGFLSYQRQMQDIAEPIDWRMIAMFIAVGTIGSFAGRRLNSRVNQRALKKGFSVFLVIMAILIVSREFLRLY